MEPFNFTEKKFLSLSEQGRHRHLMSWLSNCYHHLTTNRATPSALKEFAKKYQDVLGWGRMTPFPVPTGSEPRIWLEALSNAIHYHRVCLGIKFVDHMGLGIIQTNDKPDERIIIDCHMALDGLRSVFNIGSIIRNCEAAGFSSVILGNCPGTEHTGVKKTAMGSGKWIAQEKTKNLVEYLAGMQDKGYTIVGIETFPGACAYDQFKWQDKTIVVVGNEEYGISSHVAGACDQMVAIPMYGRKNSINVASASAIICFSVAQALTGK